MMGYGGGGDWVVARQCWEYVGEERLMRAEVREKINKIVIYTSTVIMQICTVTITNMYIYTQEPDWCRADFGNIV